MAEKPVIHGRDHLPGGADPIPAVAATGGGTGIQFDTSPQEGGFLEVTTTMTGGITLEEHYGTGISLHSEDASLGQGFISLTTGDGAVFIGSTSIVNRLSASGSGGAFEVQQGGTAFQIFRVFDTKDVQVRAAVFDVQATGGFIMALPTSAPAGSNRLWNNGGIVTIT